MMVVAMESLGLVVVGAVAVGRRWVAVRHSLGFVHLNHPNHTTTTYREGRPRRKQDSQQCTTHQPVLGYARSRTYGRRGTAGGGEKKFSRGWMVVFHPDKGLSFCAR